MKMVTVVLATCLTLGGVIYVSSTAATGQYSTEAPHHSNVWAAPLYGTICENQCANAASQYYNSPGCKQCRERVAESECLREANDETCLQS